MIRLRVIQFGDTPIVLWKFACHPTAYPHAEELSSEFPGAVRTRIREYFGQETVVLFMQGSSGDLRQPFFSNNPLKTGVNGAVKTVLSGGRSAYYLPTQTEWKTWTNGLSTQVIQLLDQCLAGPFREMACSYSETLVATNDLFDRPHEVEALQLQKVMLNADEAMLFCGAEITQALSERIENSKPTDLPRHWLCTCAGQCIGYLATIEELDDGGYEGGEWTHAFGLECQPTSQGCKEVHR